MKKNNNNDEGLFLNTVIYLFSNVLNASIPLLLLPILTRYLSPSDYGVVAMFQMVLAVFGALAGLSVFGAANRQYYESKSTINKVLSK